MKAIENIAPGAWQAGFAAGQGSSRDKKSNAAKSPYAKILLELINKQKAELEEALKRGQTMQQRALGISDEEWQRLQLQDSSLTKTDAEKEKEETQAERQAAGQKGDIETIKRIMGDGSILIVETQGGRIVSQQRKKPHMIPVANPAYIPPEKGGQPSASNSRVKMVPYQSILDLL